VKTLLALAFVATLAACGGGGELDEPSRPTGILEACRIKLDDQGFCPESEIIQIPPDISPCDAAGHFLVCTQ
jgi:hypothetical protein